jgi:hypothetical protein
MPANERRCASVPSGQGLSFPWPMARNKQRLFDPSELGPRAAPKRERRRHLHAAADPSEQLRLNRDGAGLVPGTTDGLPVRLVKPHSAEKARMVSRDLGTVGRAMGNKWFQVHYLELFCGPGYLLDDVTEEEVPGATTGARSPSERSMTRRAWGGRGRHG